MIEAHEKNVFLGIRLSFDKLNINKEFIKRLETLEYSKSGYYRLDRKNILVAIKTYTKTDRSPIYKSIGGLKFNYTEYTVSDHLKNSFTHTKVERAKRNDI